MMLFPRAVFRNVQNDKPSQALIPRSAFMTRVEEKPCPRLQFTLPALLITTTLCGIVAAAWTSGDPDTGNAILATLFCTPFAGGLLLSTWAGFCAGILAIVAIVYFDETMPFLGAIIYFVFWLWLPMFGLGFLGTLCRRWLLRARPFDRRTSVRYDG